MMREAQPGIMEWGPRRRWRAVSLFTAGCHTLKLVVLLSRHIACGFWLLKKAGLCHVALCRLHPCLVG